MRSRACGTLSSERSHGARDGRNTSHSTPDAAGRLQALKIRARQLARESKQSGAPPSVQRELELVQSQMRQLVSTVAAVHPSDRGFGIKFGGSTPVDRSGGRSAKSVRRAQRRRTRCALFALFVLTVGAFAAHSLLFLEHGSADEGAPRRDRAVPPKVRLGVLSLRDVGAGVAAPALTSSAAAAEPLRSPADALNTESGRSATDAAAAVPVVRAHRTPPRRSPPPPRSSQPPSRRPAPPRSAKRAAAASPPPAALGAQLWSLLRHGAPWRGNASTRAASPLLLSPSGADDDVVDSERLATAHAVLISELGRELLGEHKPGHTVVLGSANGAALALALAERARGGLVLALSGRSDQRNALRSIARSPAQKTGNVLFGAAHLLGGAGGMLRRADELKLLPHEVEGAFGAAIAAQWDAGASAVAMSGPLPRGKTAPARRMWRWWNESDSGAAFFDAALRSACKRKGWDCAADVAVKRGESERGSAVAFVARLPPHAQRARVRAPGARAAAERAADVAAWRFLAESVKLRSNDRDLLFFRSLRLAVAPRLATLLPPPMQQRRLLGAAPDVRGDAVAATTAERLPAFRPPVFDMLAGAGAKDDGGATELAREVSASDAAEAVFALVWPALQRELRIASRSTAPAILFQGGGTLDFAAVRTSSALAPDAAVVSILPDLTQSHDAAQAARVHSELVRLMASRTSATSRGDGSGAKSANGAAFQVHWARRMSNSFIVPGSGNSAVLSSKRAIALAVGALQSYSQQSFTSEAERAAAPSVLDAGSAFDLSVLSAEAMWTNVLRLLAKGFTLNSALSVAERALGCALLLAPRSLIEVPRLDELANSLALVLGDGEGAAAMKQKLLVRCAAADEAEWIACLVERSTARGHAMLGAALDGKRSRDDDAAAMLSAKFVVSVVVGAAADAADATTVDAPDAAERATYQPLSAGALRAVTTARNLNQHVGSAPHGTVMIRVVRHLESAAEVADPRATTPRTYPRLSLHTMLILRVPCPVDLHAMAAPVQDSCEAARRLLRRRLFAQVLVGRSSSAASSRAEVVDAAEERGSGSAGRVELGLRPWSLRFDARAGTLTTIGAAGDSIPRRVSEDAGIEADTGRDAPSAWRAALKASQWEEEERAYIAALVTPDAGEVQRLALRVLERNVLRGEGLGASASADWTMALWGCSAGTTALLERVARQHALGSHALVLHLCGSRAAERAQETALAASRSLRSVVLGVVPRSQPLREQWRWIALHRTALRGAPTAPCPTLPEGSPFLATWCPWALSHAPSLRVRTLDGATALCDGRLQSDGVPLMPTCTAIEATPLPRRSDGSDGGWSVRFLALAAEATPAAQLAALAQLERAAVPSAGPAPRVLLRVSFRRGAAASAARPKANADVATHMRCVGWRQTGGCDADGVRESNGDKGCSASIEPGSSGYCICSGNRRVKFGCAHPRVTCAAECAVEPGGARKGRHAARPPAGGASPTAGPLVELMAKQATGGEAVPLRALVDDEALLAAAQRAQSREPALVGVAAAARDMSRSGVFLRIQLLSRGLLPRLASARNVEEASLRWFPAWLSLARTSLVPLPSARRISLAVTLFGRTESMAKCSSAYYCGIAARRSTVAKFDGRLSHPLPSLDRAWHALASGASAGDGARSSVKGGATPSAAARATRRARALGQLTVSVAVSPEARRATGALRVAEFALTRLVRPLALGAAPPTIKGVRAIMDGHLLPLRSGSEASFPLLRLEMDARDAPARLVARALVTANGTLRAAVRAGGEIAALRELGSTAVETDSVAIASLLELGASAAQLRRVFGALLRAQRVSTRDVDAVSWSARLGVGGVPHFAPPTRSVHQHEVSDADGPSASGISAERLLDALKHDVRGDACNETALLRLAAEVRQRGALELLRVGGERGGAARDVAAVQLPCIERAFALGAPCAHLVRDDERCLAARCRRRALEMARHCLNFIVDGVLARQSVSAASESLS